MEKYALLILKEDGDLSTPLLSSRIHVMRAMQFVVETVMIWTDLVCVWSSLVDPVHVVPVVVPDVEVADTEVVVVDTVDAEEVMVGMEVTEDMGEIMEVTVEMAVDLVAQIIV